MQWPLFRKQGNSSFVKYFFLFFILEIDCFEGTSVLCQRFDKLSMCPIFFTIWLFFAFFLTYWSVSSKLSHAVCRLVCSSFSLTFWCLQSIVITLFHFWYWQFIIPFSFFPFANFFNFNYFLKSYLKINSLISASFFKKL